MTWDFLNLSRLKKDAKICRLTVKEVCFGEEEKSVAG